MLHCSSCGILARWLMVSETVFMEHVCGRTAVPEAQPGRYRFGHSSQVVCGVGIITPDMFCHITTSYTHVRVHEKMGTAACVYVPSRGRFLPAVYLLEHVPYTYCNMRTTHTTCSTHYACLLCCCALSYWAPAWRDIII